MSLKKLQFEIPESALMYARSLKPGVLPRECPELEAWRDEWSLETCLSYIRLLCKVMSQKCMPDTPTWSIMEFVGSTPWWILCKIYQSDLSSIGHFWSGDDDDDDKTNCKEKEPDRLYRVTTNYLSTILRSRPDFYNNLLNSLASRPDFLTSMFSVANPQHDDFNFMLKYCKINERAIKVELDSSATNSIYGYNDNIRFLHLEYTRYTTLDANDVLKVTPRLIVVSLPCYWRNLDISLYVKNIHIFMKTAPILLINLQDRHGMTIQTLYKFVKRLFYEQPPKSILIVRYLDYPYDLHPCRPYLKLLVDEPLRKYLYHNIFVRDKTIND